MAENFKALSDEKLVDEFILTVYRAARQRPRPGRFNPTRAREIELEEVLRRRLRSRKKELLKVNRELGKIKNPLPFPYNVSA